MNITLPNLMLGLSRQGHTANFAAARFAWSQLAFSLSILLGGVAFDELKKQVKPEFFGGRSMGAYSLLFALNAALLAIGVWLARRIPEPSGG